MMSALVAPAGSEDLTADLARVAAYNEKHLDAANGLVVIDVIELKATTPAAIDVALDEVPETIFPFFELPVTDFELPFR